MVSMSVYSRATVVGLTGEQNMLKPFLSFHGISVFVPGKSNKHKLI